MGTYWALLQHWLASWLSVSALLPWGQYHLWDPPAPSSSTLHRLAQVPLRHRLRTDSNFCPYGFPLNRQKIYVRTFDPRRVSSQLLLVRECEPFKDSVQAVLTRELRALVRELQPVQELKRKLDPAVYEQYANTARGNLSGAVLNMQPSGGCGYL